MGDRKPYPSEVSDEQWALIGPFLQAWKARRVSVSVSGRQGDYDLREIVNAIFYQNRTGCQWAYLPRDLPPKSATYYYFALWRDDGTDQVIDDLLRCQAREKAIPDPVAPPVPDLIGRDFTATAPDQRWCGDITYLRVGGGWLYLATVIDIATRRLIGWSINTHMRAELVIDALGAAVAARGGQVDGVIFHSDRGAQYGSGDFADACQRHGIRRAVGAERLVVRPGRVVLRHAQAVNSTSTADAGHPRPTPAATCSGGSPSTTTDAATPHSATSAPPTTNRPSHRLRCIRSRHNPVSTSGGNLTSRRTVVPVRTPNPSR